MMDEHEHETTAEDFEIVADGEPSIEDYPQPGDPDFNLQKVDDFGAPIRPPVKVRDGVRDTKTL